MYNSYKYEKKLVNQKQIRILDYRNAKYQGVITGFNLTRNGNALLLDHNYLFVMANWQNNKIQGHSFIVYPDDSIFYGFISDNSPANFCCFQTNQNFQIYSLIEPQDHIIFIIDIFSTNKLFCFSIDRNTIEEMLTSPSKNKYLLIQQYKKQNGKIQLKAQSRYINEQQKWQLINQYFKKTIKAQLHNYKSFIKSQIVEKDKQFIRMIQNKNQINIKCGNSSSIFCKILNQKFGQNSIKIKQLGFHNENENYSELFKKNINNVIQQGTNGDVKTYNRLLKKRPIECLIKLQKYYKKSTDFVNQFIQLDYLYGINYLYHSLQQCCQSIYSIRHPQLLNQSHTKSLNLYVTPIKGNSPTKTILEQAKQDIYRAIQNKNKANFSNSNIKKNQYNHTIYDNQKIQNKSSKWHDEYSQDKPKNKQKQTIQQKDVQKIRKLRQIQKIKQQINDNNIKRHEKYNRIYKMKLQKQEYSQNRQISNENLKQLTKQYKVIDQQLKRSKSITNKKHNKSHI